MRGRQRERRKAAVLARKKEVKPVSGVLHKAVSIIDAAAEEAVDEVGDDEDEADDDDDNEDHDDEEEEDNHAALKLMTLISSSAAPLRRLLCNQPQSMREPHRSSASFVRHCFCICFSNTAPPLLLPSSLLHHQRESCVHFLVAKKIKHLFFSVKNSTNLLTNQSRRH